MHRIKGVYDGEKVVVLEPLALPANTPVEILVPEHYAQEGEYWNTLLQLGLISEVCVRQEALPLVEPVPVAGVLVSHTIINERR